jgi:bifunctional non-homologous end joining protein LigD
MSKSNDFLPGANDLANGMYVQLTFSRPNPSCFATAYATADSNPLPVDGSLIFHFEPLGVPPPNHGGYAGLSVPIVSVPELMTRSAQAAEATGSASRPEASVAESAATRPTAMRAATRAISRETNTVKVGRREVRVSNPDKVFFPERGLTKGDLVRYYVELADCVLPHLRRRPFHMKRYPHGVDGEFFHQKRVPPHPEYVGEQFVTFPSGHSTVFAVVDNAAALAWVINLGCIELHTWHSRIDDIERPDYLLIDLDPTVDGQWPHVRAIALVVKEVMDELGLASYPKTSGATGLHILAPIRPELRFPDVRRFAKALAEEVERRIGDQDRATTTWRVAERRGVFVDFGQNARDRTIASAYSVRPTPDARVSAPLAWDEVADVEPEAFTLETMPDRMADAGDPMSGMRRRRASLVSRFAKLGLEDPQP